MSTDYYYSMTEMMLIILLPYYHHDEAPKSNKRKRYHPPFWNPPEVRQTLPDRRLGHNLNAMKRRAHHVPCRDCEEWSADDAIMPTPMLSPRNQSDSHHHDTTSL